MAGFRGKVDGKLPKSHRLGAFGAPSRAFVDWALGEGHQTRWFHGQLQGGKIDFGAMDVPNKASYLY